MKLINKKSWAGDLLIYSDLTLGPSSKVKQGHPNLKVLVTQLLLVLEVCNVKPTYRKSVAGNLLMCTDSQQKHYSNFVKYYFNVNK